MRILDEPVDLSVLLPTASAVVGYASAGLVSTVLMAGVPMLLIPVYLEQELTAECARRAGIAVVVHARQRLKLKECAAAISAVLAIRAVSASRAATGRAFWNAATAGQVIRALLTSRDAEPRVRESTDPGIA